MDNGKALWSDVRTIHSRHLHPVLPKPSKYHDKVAARDARPVVVVHQPPRMEYDPKAKR